jgi:hypothetical protein
MTYTIKTLIWIFNHNLWMAEIKRGCFAFIREDGGEVFMWYYGSDEETTFPSVEAAKEAVQKTMEEEAMQYLIQTPTNP